MATSSQHWKPVSRRTTVLPDGSILLRTLTSPERHEYNLYTPKGVRNISLEPTFKLSDFSFSKGRGYTGKPVHKSRLLELGVGIRQGRGAYVDLCCPVTAGSPKDFHSIGHDVVRNVGRALQKLYPKMRGIYGSRTHKLPTANGESPVTLFKFKNRRPKG